MSAEPIATVMNDLHEGRVRLLGRLGREALGAIRKPTVVNCTKIYESLLARDEPVYLYEDHPSIISPWDEAAFSYVNEHGNVVVMHLIQRPYDHSNAQHRRAVSDLSDVTARLDPDNETGPWKPHGPVEWDRVKWICNTFIWIGGHSKTAGKAVTTGPVHMWQFAIYDDGGPADLHWVHLIPEYEMTHWDSAQLVLLGALNFLNCRNVSIEEPKRSRPERRRLERLGVQVHEIMVTPSGRSTRSQGDGEGTGIMPLTSVRGHFALYGPKYGRGLLFGKLEGRFWIPQHARGDAAHGEDEHSYIISQ